MTAHRTYTDAEVDEAVGKLMAVLPSGSHITSRIINGGKGVTLEVTLAEGKRDIFEHGLSTTGNWRAGYRQRLGPALDESALKAILEWSKKP